MPSSELKSAKNVSEMNGENKNDSSALGSLDGNLDIRMMKAESHRLEKLFHEIDTNKDGRINAHELSEGLKRMGYCHITEEQVEVSYYKFIICYMPLRSLLNLAILIPVAYLSF